MSAPVPDRPPITELQAVRVGRPVSHRHGRAWQETLHFLLGFNTPPIAASTFMANPTASPADYVFGYKRSPGCRSLAVAVELREPDAVGDRCDVNVTRDAGGTAYLPTAQGDLRGARNLLPQKGAWTSRTVWLDFIDVSALTVGTLEWIRVTWTDGAGAAGGTHGLYRLHVFEVPRRTLADDSTDAGLDGAWPFAGNALWDGTSSTLDGFKRLAAEIDRARTEVRQHRQLVSVEAIADAWQCGVNVGAWAPVTFGRSVQPGFFCRARRLRTTTTNNLITLACRYSTQHATAGAQLQMVATSRTTGTVVNTVLALPASGVGVFVASAEQAGGIPCDGTDQEVRVTFEFQTDLGANLVISNISVIEAET